MQFGFLFCFGWLVLCFALLLFLLLLGFNLLFLYLLLITNYASCVSSSHGPDVPDDVPVGMMGLMMGPVPQAAPQGLCLQPFDHPAAPFHRTTEYVLPGSRTQNQTQYSRYSLEVLSRNNHFPINPGYASIKFSSG